MTSPTRRAVILSLGASCLLAVSLPAPSLAEEDDRPHFVVAMENFPPMLEMLEPSTRRTSGFRLAYSIYDGLLDLDYLNNHSVIAGLATDWERISDTEIELTIREDVYFHDGTKMTVEDIAFSLGPERATNEDAPGHAQLREYMPGFKEIVIVDDNTIRVVTEEPSPVIISQLAAFGSQIISEDAYRAAGSWEEWAMTPVATGPYKVVEYRPDELIRLDAHDQYWGGRPPAASVTFVLVTEESARVAGLFAGDFDLITNVSFDQIAQIEAAEGVEIVGGDTRMIRGVYFDSQTNPHLADPRLRRALALAIDRELIVETLWDNRVTIPNGPQTPAFGDMYIAEHQAPRYDPEQARALVAETDYDGEPIPLRMISSEGYAGEFATAQVLVEMWRQIGVNVELELMENWAQIANVPGRGIRNSGDSMLYPDPTAQFWRRFGTDGWVQRNGWWTNEEFNELGQVLIGSLNIDERRAAFARMLEIFDHEDPPATIFHTGAEFYGKRTDFQWTAYPDVRTDFRAHNLSFD